MTALAPDIATEAPVAVLIVDDDDSLRGLIGEFLRNQAFDVFEAAGGVAMREILARNAIDVIILDVMMPGEDGLSLAREIAAQSNVAIIFISALGGETDRIVGLEVGADDYLTKPVSPRELLARVRAVLRRRLAGAADPAEAGSVYLFAGWSFDTKQRVLRDPSSVVVTLSHGELVLLTNLLERPQRVLTRDQLLEWTHRDADDVFDRSIDTQISRLRRKLASRHDAEIVRTIRNEGYMFVPKVTRR